VWWRTYKMKFGEEFDRDYSCSLHIRSTGGEKYGCERGGLFFSVFISLALHIFTVLIVSTAVAISSNFTLSEDPVLHVSLVSVTEGSRTDKKGLPEIKARQKQSNESKGKIDEYRVEIKSIEGWLKDNRSESKSPRVMEISVMESTVAMTSPPSVAIEEDISARNKAWSYNSIAGNQPVDAISLALPQYRENAHPSYPRVARKHGYEGLVLLSAEVFADGRVGDVRIARTSGYDVLDRSALDAVKTWRFEPGRRKGKPDAMWVDVPIKFVLKDQPR